MLKRIIPVLVVAVALVLSPLHAENAWASACGLSGEGTGSSPWLVANASDFQVIGDGGCLRSGHYKQTANITLESAESDPPPTTSFATSFSGVYDGDYYTITLAGTNAGGWGNHTRPWGIFGIHLSGTIQKLFLTGVYTTSHYWGQPLVQIVNQGGVISQVHSSVNVTVTGDADTIRIGGLVNRLGRGALMEYSSATGKLHWNPGPLVSPSPGLRPSIFGGLVVEAGPDENGIGANNPRSTEIRDSYSRVTVEWPVDRKCRATFGGITGLVPTDPGADVYLVRVYSASYIEPDSLGGSACTGAFSTVVGGLIGRSDPTRALFLGGVPSFTYLVSSFWATDLINSARSIGTQSSSDTNYYVDGVPRGVGLLAASLKDITTYQSREGASTGLPSGTSNLPIASSIGSKSTDGTLATNAGTYRWGIEPGDQQVFVPVTYTDPQDFLTRTVFTDAERAVARSMAGRGGTLEGPVSNYPHLGRIWEICASENDGFPTLVWEGKTCGGKTGGAYTGVAVDDSVFAGGSSGQEESSSPGGSRTAGQNSVSVGVDAEVPALAATGTNGPQSLLLLMTSTLLMFLGGAFLWQRRGTRQVSLSGATE